MHYYQFNIADYRKDTMHLTRLEHGIYRDLIDWYYLDERPIPNETQVVSRRLRLVSPEEAAALQNVLSDFFIPSDDGYKHARIDAEIASYNATCEKNKENGKKGGRPKAVKHLNCNEDNPVGSDSVANGNPNESEINPNQEPITKNQEPKGKPLRAARFDVRTHLSNLGISDSIISDWLALRKTKRAAVTQTAIYGIQSEADKAGVTLEDALRECCVRGWSGFNSDWKLSKSNRGARASPPSLESKNKDSISEWMPPEMRVTE